MSITRKYDPSGMEPKDCFEAWLDAGTLSKATELLSKKGCINLRTGLPFTRQSVYKYSILFLRDNISEARSVLLNRVIPFAIDDVTFHKWIIGKVIPSGRIDVSKIPNWIKENNLSEYLDDEVKFMLENLDFSEEYDEFKRVIRQRYGDKAVRQFENRKT